jgi:hypothetical protein
MVFMVFMVFMVLPIPRLQRSPRRRNPVLGNILGSIELLRFWKGGDGFSYRLPEKAAKSPGRRKALVPLEKNLPRRQGNRGFPFSGGGPGGPETQFNGKGSQVFPPPAKLPLPQAEFGNIIGLFPFPCRFKAVFEKEEGQKIRSFVLYGRPAAGFVRFYRRYPYSPRDLIFF